MSLQFIIIMILDVLKYNIVYSGLYNKVLKRYFICICNVVLFGVISVLFADLGQSILYLLETFLVVATVCLQQEKYTSKRIVKPLFLLLIISCFDAALSFIYVMFTGIKLSSMMDNVYKAFIGSVILFFIFFVKRYAKKKMSIFFFDKFIWLLCILLAIIILIPVYSLHFFTFYLDNVKYIFMARSLSLLGVLGLLLLMLFMFNIRNINEILKNDLLTLEELKRMQSKYYDIVLQKENHTRQFRHDLKNHYVVLKQYIDNEKWEELYQYILQLDNQLEKTTIASYDTGNMVINSLNAYYFERTCATVKTNYTGFITVDFPEISLCTLYGNLLSNAVDAVKNNSDGVLDVSYKQGKQFCEIIVKNSCSDMQMYQNIIENKTHKLDANNHGFGLKNIQSAVKELDGQIEYSYENNVVCARVILPIK